MPHDKSSDFIVVECQKAPNSNGKRVCIPRTWVLCEMGAANKVAIVYPSEDASRIATRLKNKEPADPEWQSYVGEIKYEAKSYEDAIIGFVKNGGGKHNKQNEDKKRHKRQKQKTGKENSKNESNAEGRGSLKLCINLRDIGPMPEKNKKSKKSLKKHLKAHAEGKSNKSKHKKVQKAVNKNIQDSKNTAENTLDSIEPQVDINSPPPQLKQIILNNTDVSKRKADLEKEMDVTFKNFSPADKQFLINLQIEQQDTLEKIKGLTLYIKTLYLKVSENKESLRQIFLKYQDHPPAVAASSEKANDQNTNTLNEDKGLPDDEIENEEECQKENDNAFSEDKSVQDDEIENEEDNEERLIYEEEEEEKEMTREDTEDVEMNNDSDQETEPLIYEEEEEEDEEEEIARDDTEDVEMDNESDQETLLTPKVTNTKSKRYISSPSSPKINKNNRKRNSRWTLKHPRSGPRLAQLGNSGIYVSAKGLEKSKKTSRDVRTFARKLLTEVFTQEALETCTMAGQKAFIGRNKGTSLPPLHSHARTVIQNYALSYGQAVGWVPIKLSTLVHSLRCFLVRMRSRREMRLGSN